MTHRWVDDAAGPVVRPYTMTRGRTRSSVSSTGLDMIALVIAVSSPEREQVDAGEAPTDDSALAPEHLDIVARCGRGPRSVAELATDLDVPVGVVRVLIGDLVEAELVRVTRPVPPAELPDESILREVINGLRAL